MHSRGYFIVFKKKDLKDPPILDEEEILKQIGYHLIDYVNLHTDLENDVGWIKGYYNLEIIKEKEIFKCTNAQEMYKVALEKRLADVKNAYEKFKLEPNSYSGWLLSDEAYPRTGFLYILEGVFYQEFDFLDRIKDEKIEKFYIYKSFDYHF